MPLTSRPLSILSLLKARPSKQSVNGAPNTAPQPVTISAPVVVVADIMPPSNLNRPSKMIAYAKTGSVSGAGAVTTAQGGRDARRADTPAMTMPEATRPVTAQQPRIPVSKPTQYSSSAPVHHRHGSQSSQGSVQPQSPPQTQASPSMRRTRTNSDTREGRVWDSSSLANSVLNTSSLTDWEREATNTRGVQPKYWNLPHDSHLYQNHTQTTRTRQSHDLAPFVIAENGLINVVPSQVPGPSITTINSSVQSGIISEHDAAKEHFHGEGQYRPQTQAQSANRQVLKNKLPLRDIKLRNSYTGHISGYVGDEEMLSSSPTYSPRHHHRYDNRKKDDGLDSKRTTEFHDVEEAIEEPSESDFTLDSNPDLNEQPTPKTKAKPKPRGLLESSMPPVMKEDDKSRKRRRTSLDYKESQLKGMRYEELQQQPFDFNPAKGAAQIGGATAIETLHAQLQHYKGQNEAAQRNYFTDMSVADWEKSGDWFMDQFSGLTQKLKEARQARRAVVTEFETEIANREEMVRFRTQSIGDKLGKLKEDGENMLLDTEI